MALIRQDVNALKCESTLQHNTTLEGVDNGEVDEMRLPSHLQLSAVVLPLNISPEFFLSTSAQSSSWAKEMGPITG